MEENMKFIFCLFFIGLCSGCAKITDLATTKTTETEQTGDPIHDQQNEMKILVPWDLFV